MATFSNPLSTRWDVRPADPWEMLRANLLHHYGPERTASILAGTDEKTNADLAKWRALGRGTA